MITLRTGHIAQQDSTSTIYNRSQLNESQMMRTPCGDDRSP